MMLLRFVAERFHLVASLLERPLGGIQLALDLEPLLSFARDFLRPILLVVFEREDAAIQLLDRALVFLLRTRDRLLARRQVFGRSVLVSRRVPLFLQRRPLGAQGGDAGLQLLALFGRLRDLFRGLLGDGFLKVRLVALFLDAAAQRFQFEQGPVARLERRLAFLRNGVELALEVGARPRELEQRGVASAQNLLVIVTGARVRSRAAAAAGSACSAERARVRGRRSRRRLPRRGRAAKSA